MKYPSPKIVTLIKVCVSMIASLLAVVFAFSSMFTIDTTDSALASTLNDGIAYFLSDVEGAEDMEIPDEVTVTPGKFYTAANIVVKLVNVAVSAVNSLTSETTAEDRQKYEENVQALEDLLESEEGRESIIMVVALLSQIVDLSDLDSSLLSSDESADDSSETYTEEDVESAASNIISTILLTIVRGIALLYLMCFVAFYGIILAISFLIKLIRVLTHLKSLDEVSGKVCGKLSGSALSLIILAMLFMTVLNGIQIGFGIVALFALAIVEIACSVICTRLRKYEKHDLRYVNIVQGTALVGTAGFMCFFFGAQNTGILRSFINSMSAYLIKLISNGISINSILQANKQSTLSAPLYGNFACLADIALVLIAALATVFMCTRIIKILVNRITLSASKRRDKGSGIGMGITALIITMLPIAASMLKNAKLYEATYNSSSKLYEVTVASEESILTLSSASMSALIVMIVGAVLLIASSILYIVLEKKFCHNVARMEEEMVIEGRAPDYGMSQENNAEDNNHSDDESEEDSEDGNTSISSKAESDKK